MWESRRVSDHRSATLARCPGRNAAGCPGVGSQVVQPNDLVVGITDMLRRTLGGHITLSTSLAREVWPTRADPGQFHSANINRAVIARDAMPQGGKPVAENRNVVLNEEHADFLPELQPDEFVQLSIADTGTGMRLEVATTPSSPFVTDKQ